MSRQSNSRATAFAQPPTVFFKGSQIIISGVSEKGTSRSIPNLISNFLLAVLV